MDPRYGPGQTCENYLCSSTFFSWCNSGDPRRPSVTLPRLIAVLEWELMMIPDPIDDDLKVSTCFDLIQRSEELSSPITTLLNFYQKNISSTYL